MSSVSAELWKLALTLPQMAGAKDGRLLSDFLAELALRSEKLEAQASQLANLKQDAKVPAAPNGHYAGNGDWPARDRLPRVEP